MYQRIYSDIIKNIEQNQESFTYTLPKHVNQVQSYDLCKCIIFCMVKLRQQGHQVRFEQPNFIWIHKPFIPPPDKITPTLPSQTPSQTPNENCKVIINPIKPKRQTITPTIIKEQWNQDEDIQAILSGAKV